MIPAWSRGPWRMIRLAQMSRRGVARADSFPPDQGHELPDGRTLAWCEYGAPRGAPVFYLHGIPGSRIDGRLTADAITAAGLRLIAPDRPGFGKSSLGQNGRSYGGWASDIERLADLLGIDRFAILAYSAGGPYALAACLNLADRVTKAAIVSGLAPSEMPGYRKQVGPTDRVITLLAPRAPWLARFLVGLSLAQARKKPERFGKSVNHDFKAPADQRILDDELRPLLPELFLESGRNGPAGIVEDFVVWARPSGLDLGQVSTPVHIWHGEDDRTVPNAHGRWVASQVPSAELTIWPGVGHLHTPERWAEVYSRLS
jgi:pimeloyl-ACP methyl ester carboxylesterase